MFLSPPLFKSDRIRCPERSSFISFFVLLLEGCSLASFWTSARSPLCQLCSLFGNSTTPSLLPLSLPLSPPLSLRHSLPHTSLSLSPPHALPPSLPPLSSLAFFTPPPPPWLFLSSPQTIVLTF